MKRSPSKMYDCFVLADVVLMLFCKMWLEGEMEWDAGKLSRVSISKNRIKRSVVY